MSEPNYLFYMAVIMSICVAGVILLVAYTISTDRKDRQERFEEELRAPSFPPARGLVPAPKGKHAGPSEDPTPDPVIAAARPEEPAIGVNEEPTYTPVEPAPVFAPEPKVVTKSEPSSVEFARLPTLPEPVAKAVTKVVAKKVVSKRTPKAVAKKTPSKAVPKKPKL